MSGNKFNFLTDITISDQADYIGRYLPNDETFEAKSVENTNLRDMLEVLGSQLRKFQEQTNILTVEVDPSCAIQLLTEWERMLGIPDDCFKIANQTTIQRQRNALIKLAKMSVQTNEDFTNLANSFGIIATIQSGVDFVNDGGSPFPGGDTEARFTVVITFEEAVDEVFPFTFPILFGSEILGLLQCVFRKILPANCNALFIVEAPEVVGDWYFSLSEPATPLTNPFNVNRFGTLDSDISIQVGDTITLTYKANFNTFNGNFIQSLDGLSFFGFGPARLANIAGFTVTINGNEVLQNDTIPRDTATLYPVGGSRNSHLVVMTCTSDNDIHFIGEAGVNSPIFDVTIVTQTRTYFYPIDSATATNPDSNGSGNDLVISSFTTISNNPIFYNQDPNDLVFPYVTTDATEFTISSSIRYGEPSLRLDGAGKSINFNASTRYLIQPDFNGSLIAYKDGFTLEFLAKNNGVVNSVGRACGLVSATSNSFLNSLWLIGFDDYTDPGNGVKIAFSLLNRNSLYHNSSSTSLRDIRSVDDVVLDQVYHLMFTIRPSVPDVEFWIDGVSQGIATLTQPEMDAWFFGALAEFGLQDVKNGIFATRFDIGPRLTNGAWRSNQISNIQDLRVHLLEANQAFADQQFARNAPL